MTLPDDLQRKWDEAEETGEPVLVGESVVCDMCDSEYTESNESGGFIFGSKAVCPTCAPSFQASAERYGETGFIRAHCPADKSFADFVREYRGPDASIHFRSLNT